MGTALAQRTDVQEPSPTAVTPEVTTRSTVKQPRQGNQPGTSTLPLATDTRPTPASAPYLPNEFERFVQAQGYPDVKRLGADLVALDTDEPGAEFSPQVPNDYLVSAGDEVLVTLWGSIDASLQLQVDRGGRIAIPRVGTVQVGGLRYSELHDAISRQVGRVFRNFELSVSLGRLRGIRVIVTGFAVRPGSYTVSSLSTVVVALMRAGGPSGAGSFRNIELRRGGALLSRFDLYDLLLQGDRSADKVLQSGDVIYIGKISSQVALVGSVNKPAIVELKPEESLRDALRYCGGFSSVAERNRVAIERLSDRLNARVTELPMPQSETTAMNDGDLIRVFSAVDSVLPSQGSARKVRIEGEVLRPGNYVLPEGTSLRSAIAAAGGLTPSAYVFAAEFMRERIKVAQQENYDRVLRELETDLQRDASSRRASSSEEAALQQANLSNSERMLARMRAIKPTGRLVLDTKPESKELPDLALEDGDRLYIPARSTTVGVFGSVFNAASYLYIPNRTLDDYLRLAGGITRNADERGLFVVRANGQVVSSRQVATFFGGSAEFGRQIAQPGDTIFAPAETDKTTFLQASKDWTLLLYQLGVGLAGLKNAFR